MVRLLLFLSLLVLPASAQDSYTDSYPKNPGIDVQRYVFELTLADGSNQIEGRTTVDARFLEPTQMLRLDLIGQTDEGGMTVQSVHRDGRALAYTHEGDALVIDLGQFAEAGERLEVQVTYSGRPAAGLRIGPNKHEDWTWFSDNWSSRVRNWLPTVDHPYDKAANEFVVTAPSNYQVVSNGVRVEETDLGGAMRTTHWVNDVPTATWLYFLGVAEFAMEEVDRFDGKPIETWVYRQDREAGFHDFAVPSRQVLAFYSDLIGPYAYDRLANVVSPATGGGMEAASTPAYSERSVSGQRERRWQHVIIHEIAHQWFGNVVTEYHWNDVWLSEGFATYYTLLFRQHAYGHDDFVAGLKDARERVINYYADDYDFQLVRPYIEDLNDVSGGMMYQKGAWILHMLRERLGQDTYNAGVREYYREHFNGNASTADFRRHMEEASGQDLTGYFDQWLFQGGIPELEIDWSQNGETFEMSLMQVQPAYGFHLEADFQLVYEDGTTMPFSLRIGPGERANAEYQVAQRVVDVAVDPETRLLAKWRVERR